MKIVGKGFSREAFEAYVGGVELEAWVPELIVVHHTAAPSLAMRPKGFTAQHMENLAHYYGTELGWSAGPHLFVDDHLIWVFSPLDRRGVHAKSFNRLGWGIEMLGDFDSEDPWSGRGLAVLENTRAAIAALDARLPRRPMIKFHREDAYTNKTCPGTRIGKEEFLEFLATGLPPKGGRRG